MTATAMTATNDNGSKRSPWRPHGGLWRPNHDGHKPWRRLQSTHGVAHEVNGSFLKFLYKNRQFGKASLWDDICV